jgi:phage/plasmid-like protein (TIGR03299 family)
MAANISFADGKAEAAFALKPAWWDAAGKYVLDKVPTSEEMIRAAHLDWEVQSQPIYSAEGKVIDGYRTTVRADNGTHLGVVTDSYRVVQNAEGFRFLDDLFKDGIMRYESAGALRGGRTIWALARMPSVDTIAEGDELLRYCLWLNSHDGTGSIYAIPTSVRVVCANTAALAIRGQRGIKHVGDMSTKLKQAHELLAQADRQFTGFNEKAQVLATRRYHRVDARQYVSTLLPSPENFGRSLSIRERKVESIRSALRNERQSIPSIQGTWWSLYNAVSEAVDHGQLFAWKGKGSRRAENRMSSVMFGLGAEFKQEAFNLAYEMAVAA